MSDIHILETDLDLKQNLNIYTICKQLDTLHLVFNVYNDGLQADLNNYNVRLKAMKSDKVPLIQDTDITVVANEVTIIGDEQLTTTSGNTLVELQFINKTTGEKKATFNLNLKVIASTLEIDRTISTATYTLLQELENKLDQASDINENISEAIDANTALNTSIINATTSKTNLDGSISTANTTKTNLDSSNTTANTTKTALNTSITNANNSKAALDISKTNADASKVALDTSITNANSFVSAHGDIIDLDARVTQNTTQLSEKANQNQNINGNFDVWQRGTTTTNPTTGTYLADRFRTSISVATPPTTVTHSRPVLTSGDIPNAYYYYRVATSGSGTFDADNFYALGQAIENGVRNLCGANKKITVSFWARSSIPNKKLGVFLAQGYGTGGSPSTREDIPGKYFVLTTNWVKYTVTIPTNTIVGKIFGTNNDDYLRTVFVYAYGSNFSMTVGDTIAESFRGSGYIDIAQIKTESGDNATPFVPRLYGEELALCQRYYEIGTSESCLGILASAMTGFKFKVPKKAIPTVTVPEIVDMVSFTAVNATPVVTDIYGVNELDGTGFNTNRIYRITSWKADAEIY
jgi:hypothetical protein